MDAGPLLLAVMGPTASGKSGLAEALATRFDAQLVNADAFQIYRGMDIGTAKPPDRGRYSLLDLKDPNEQFGVGEWLALAAPILSSAYDAGKSVVLVGGSGLYVRALIESYKDLRSAPDPELRRRLMEREETEGLQSLADELTTRAPMVAAGLDLNNPARVRRALERLESPDPIAPARLPPFRILKLGLVRNVLTLQHSIETRVQQMLHNGWLHEVNSLRAAGYSPTDPGFRALGYSDLWRHLVGEMELQDAVANIVRDTRRYAKRQRTWLRTEPRLELISAETHEDSLRQSLEKINGLVGG